MFFFQNIGHSNCDSYKKEEVQNNIIAEVHQQQQLSCIEYRILLTFSLTVVLNLSKIL